MDFNDKPGSYEMILGRPFMREHSLVHDWSRNHVYLTLNGEHVRVDLKSGKAHPLAHGFFHENSDTTVFSDSDATTSLNYCKTCKKETDPEHKDYTIDYKPAFDDDWNHLLATVDVWGKRGITCVTADGTPIPEVVPLNTFSVEHLNDTEESNDSDPSPDSSTNGSEEESVNKPPKSRKSFKLWQRGKRTIARRNQRVKDCTTSAQWLQYVGAFDANRKLVNDWGERLQHLMHRKSPHIELKKIDTQKESKSSKASRRRKNREAAQAERQAKKELRESKAKDVKTDS